MWGLIVNKYYKYIHNERDEIYGHTYYPGINRYPLNENGFEEIYNGPLSFDGISYFIYTEDRTNSPDIEMNIYKEGVDMPLGTSVANPAWRGRGFTAKFGITPKKLALDLMFTFDKEISINENEKILIELKNKNVNKGKIYLGKYKNNDKSRVYTYKKYNGVLSSFAGSLKSSVAPKFILILVCILLAMLPLLLLLIYQALMEFK